jgi:hypothetical protein
VTSPRSRGGWLLLVLIIVSAACSSAGDDTQPPPSADIDDRASGTDRSRADPGVPDTCTPEGAGDLVLGLFDAVSLGEVDVDRFFAADADGFGWLSIEGPGSGPGDAEDRSLLAPYFESRISAGETMRLIEMDVSYEPARDLGNLSLLVTRTADDIPPDEQLFAGKGAIRCASGRLVVLAMGPSEEMQGPCSGVVPTVEDAASEPIVCEVDA